MVRQLALLDDMVRAQKRGIPAGITSICSAHPAVIEAAFAHAAHLGAPVLIESTCNQVNQYGGYTGMTPADFAQAIRQQAEARHFPPERLILGGDHLGPNVWQDEPAQQAMDKACALARDTTRAGYAKIHLDASMRLGGDPPDAPLQKEVSARRAADLARSAEDAFREMGEGRIPPRYIVGTEVPPPGGIQDHGALVVTTPQDAAETLDITREAFLAQGLEDAWERVIGVVVQPGVEYGDDTILDYDPAQAQPLARFIEASPQIVYEAHSTDYQTREALRRLVIDHFAILKVGPALTFAFREAVFALALIEDELAAVRGVEPSSLRAALDAAMLAEPGRWRRYYQGSPARQRLARQYSFSDRARYYWTVPSVQAALDRLLRNLSGAPIPLALVSQYLPVQAARIREGLLPNEPRALVRDRITATLMDYSYACGLA